MGVRALLVQAPSVEGPHAEVVAPLGLGAVAAAARERGHRVGILDLNLEALPYAALEEALGRESPRVVGVGLRNIDPLANRRHSYLPRFAAVLATVRRVLPAALVAAGGAGFSMFPRLLMERYPAIDAGVVLEGEETFAEILDRVDRGAGPGDLAGIPGTLVRGPDGRVRAGPPRPRLPGEALDRPRPWLPDLVRGYRGASSYAPPAGVETKRGCPLGCVYCVYPALQGRTLRFRSPGTIAAEVELLSRDAGVAWVHFTDPVLNLPPEHFREVCRALIARRLPVRWTGFFREDALTPADARLAVEAGCAAFQFSGDGTCDRTLARLRKGLALEHILGAARAVAGTQALAVYHFMANVPGTDGRAVREALDLVERLHDIHGPRGNLGTMVFNNIRIYPGTPLEAELRAAGALRGPETLLYPAYHDPEPHRDMRYLLEERHELRACRWRPGKDATR